MQQDDFRLEESLGFLLTQVARAVARDLQARLTPYGITPAQLCALTCLWEEDGLPTAVLAARAGFDAATTTGILDRLTRQELVERRRGEEDRRVVTVHLSERGAALQEVLPHIARESDIAAVTGLSSPETERLRALLRHLLANLSSPTE